MCDNRITVDPTTQKIFDDLDVHAKKRAAELLGDTAIAHLQVPRVTSFCLGYKAGIIDLGIVQRQEAGTGFGQMSAVFAAACVWRDAPHVPGHEERLRAAVDAAMVVRKKDTP
jgi:hypothetical protein